MSDDNRRELRRLQMLARSLSQMSDGGDRIKELLHRVGMGLVAEAKKRAPVKGGALRRAISYRLMPGDRGVEFGVLGRDADRVPYAQITEIGGVIRPKNAKWLTIPLDPKYEGVSPRAFDMAFVTLGGKAYMVDRMTGRLAYRLKKRVTRKADPYMKPAIEEFRDKRLSKIIDKIYGKILGDI